MIRVSILTCLLALSACSASAPKAGPAQGPMVPATQVVLPVGSTPTFPSVAFDAGTIAAPKPGQTVAVRVTVGGARTAYRVRWLLGGGKWGRLVARGPSEGAGPQAATFEADLSVNAALNGPKTVWVLVQPKDAPGVLVRGSAVVK